MDSQDGANCKSAYINDQSGLMWKRKNKMNAWIVVFKVPNKYTNMQENMMEKEEMEGGGKGPKIISNH